MPNHGLNIASTTVPLFLHTGFECALCFIRLMKAQTLGDTASLEFMRGRRILEINPDHPIVKDLNVSPAHDFTF